MSRFTSSSRFVLFGALAVGMSVLAGCTVGPKYIRPNYPAPPAFRGAEDAPVVSDAKASLGDEDWSERASLMAVVI